MQAPLPIMAGGVLSAKQDLHSFMQAMGHAAVEWMFEHQVNEPVGPEGKHQRGRTRYRWGQADAEFTPSGRRVTLSRPRVRERGPQRGAWVARKCLEASKRVGRIKGHAHMSTLIVALRGEERHEQAVVDTRAEAA